MNKQCSKCGIEKSLEDFYKDKAIKSGYKANCKLCEKLHKRNTKTLIAKRESLYKKNNRGKQNSYTVKYRASKLKATPLWADLEAIKEFYINCPKGYHVDHIVPLQGKNVRGLHVLKNLQYLTASENCSKGNIYESD